MKTKAFDAVKVMRAIRDKMSRKYARMTPEEEIADLQKRLAHIPWKKQAISRKRRGCQNDQTEICALR